jgi:hypothetical protein
MKFSKFYYCLLGMLLMFQLDRGRSAHSSYKWDEEICQNFFGLLVSDSCSFVGQRMHVISAQMVTMGSTYSLFINEKTLDCSMPYPNIHLVRYNKEQVLQRCGVPETLHNAQHVPHILRVCIAKEFSMSYFDTHIHMLKPDKRLYQVPYISTPIYKEENDGIAISSDAFCLPQEILAEVLRRQIAKEAGNPFLKTLLNRYAVRMYSQNSPGLR